MRTGSAKAAQTLARTLAQGRRWLLASHLNPDGDAIGAMVGLSLILEGLGQETVTHNGSGVPAPYRFLPGSERVQSQAPEVLDFDGLIVLDSGELKRIGDLAERVQELPLLINLDHHVPKEPWGDVAWIEEEAPAVGTMVLELAGLLKARIDPQAALNLYTAIMTDTGRFQHGNTDAETLAAAAELARLGADPALAAREVYQTYTEGRLKLLARALGTLELHQGGLVALMTLRRDDFKETGTSLVDMDNFVDYARGVKGVEVAATLREEEGGYKISLRSTGKADVARLAAAFGGGGHRMAAGAFMEGGLDQVRERLVKGVRDSLAGGRDG